jgi:glycosyltransferase involved in cell wall biosynthesis
MSNSGEPVLGMILKGYPRISETFISNEILLLERLGFKIHLFSMRRGRESFTHRSVREIAARVDYLPESLLKPLPRLLKSNLSLAARTPGPYRRALAAAWQRWRRTHKSATLKHLFQAGYLIDRFLPHSGVVHLHAHFAHSPTSVAMFTSRLSGLPFSFTAHAKDIYTSNPQQLSEKIALAEKVVTCTEYNRRYLLDLAGDSAPGIYRVYHGIDTALFSDEGRSDTTASAPYQLVTVARLVVKKGLPTVYRALERLKARGVVFRHTLIGDGEERQSILELIDQLALEGCCRWIGTQPHHVVRDHYRKAHAFVLGCEVAPDGDRDGIPNVLLESMAMGVPVAATTVSAIPELITTGETGLLVPPGDAVQLAAAVERLLVDKDLRHRLIPAARHRVRHHFDNRQSIQELADIHRKALEKAARYSVTTGKWNRKPNKSIWKN